MCLCLNEAKLERLDAGTADRHYHLHHRVASPALLSRRRGRMSAGPGLVTGACFNSFTRALLSLLARSKDTAVKCSETDRRPRCLPSVSCWPLPPSWQNLCQEWRCSYRFSKYSQGIFRFSLLFFTFLGVFLKFGRLKV